MAPKEDQKVNENRYCVIPRTLIFLFDEHGQVLLIKGAKNKRLWAGLFNGIGGHIEPGEDIQTAAQRELKEETGLSNIYLILCGQIMIDVTEKKGVALFIFRGDYSGDQFRHSSEGEVIWTAIKDMDSVSLVEDIVFLLPRIAQYRPCAPLIVGHYAYDRNGELTISFG